MMNNPFILGDKVRVRGERVKGEILSFGTTPKGVFYATIQTTNRGVRCVPIEKLYLEEKPI